MNAHRPLGEVDFDTSRSRAEEVRQLAGKASVLAREAGFIQDAEVLRSEENRQSIDQAVVVVVGETKRGKSSLVNALLGRRDLAPVDPDVATGTSVLFTYGDVTAAQVFRANQPEPEHVSIERVAEFAADRGPSTAVTSVLVTLDAPLLRSGVVLADTAGLGSLVGGHKERTLSSLSLADALLFVVDASTPLTAPDLAFLEAATRRVGTVLFALTKVDVHRNWRRILDENRRLLTSYAPALASCPVFPVASPLAFPDDPELTSDDVERLRSSSGVGELASALIEQVGARRVDIRTHNACRVVTAAIDRIEKLEQMRLRAAERDPRLEAELRVTLDELSRLTSSDGRWRSTLTEEFEKLRSDVTANVELGVRRVGDEISDIIVMTDPAEIDGMLEKQLRLAIEGLWLECLDMLYRGSERIYSEVLVSLIGLTGGIELPPPPTPDMPVEYRPRSVVEVGSATGIADAVATFNSGYELATTLMKLVGALGLVATTANPGWLVVPGWFAARELNHLRQRDQTRRARQQEAAVVVRRVLEDARTRMGNQLVHAFSAVRRSIEDEASTRLMARQDELKRLAKERRQAVDDEVADSAAASALARSRLLRIAELRQIATEVQSLADATPVLGNPDMHLLTGTGGPP